MTTEEDLKMDDDVQTTEHSEVDGVPTRVRVLEPLADRVIIRVVKDAEVLASGIVIPDSVRERSQRGIVLAVGPGRWEDGERVPMGVEVGDMLLFSKYGGTELPEGFTDESRDLGQLVLREADILCIERFEEPEQPGTCARWANPVAGEERSLDAVEEAIRRAPVPTQPDPMKESE